MNNESQANEIDSRLLAMKHSETEVTNRNQNWALALRILVPSNEGKLLSAEDSRKKATNCLLSHVNAQKTACTYTQLQKFF